MPVSSPRLELNGALLLARLYTTCKNILKEYDVHFYVWTDSQVVLSWLSSHPRNWKPYIANRTSEILDLVPAYSWHYVPTKMNPAGIACRGLSPKELPTCALFFIWFLEEISIAIHDFLSMVNFNTSRVTAGDAFLLYYWGNEMPKYLLDLNKSTYTPMRKKLLPFK
ncbi:uncharacterized protein TNIN_484671 [Trichonephila inaurata madagascariensis]|uniref:Uncharacterized protein n=1 Tax=Trichonephila inaurata madagascariensis TaxID=2747483 RepID=A0A8X6JXF7_9ARAC|nr:uncharacterized protein TNIN_484671 [Trichonephila inaurata madagascariensis]